MCQILFAHKNNPPMDVLEYANDRNKHGFGYAWSEGSLVKWSKGFSGESNEDFTNGIADFLSKPFPKAIHFRLATHGGVSQELTHPFPIKRGNPLALTGESKMVLFHNGVWSKWDDCLREAIFGGTINPNVLREPMSDSRAMAILCQRFGPDILDVLPLASNKVLVLMHDTWYRYGDWKEMDGWYASNHSVEKPTYVKGTTARTERKGTHGIHIVDATITGGQRYLSADREEVEQSLLQWGDRRYE